MIQRKNFKKFYVKPQLPDNMHMLTEISENIWSTWDPDAYQLFTRIDPLIFRKFNHNPVKLLQQVSNERLKYLSENIGFMGELKSVYKKFRSYRDYNAYYIENGNKMDYHKNFKIAYLSMEFGLHESLPIYSGGLGILSGDHLKAASDLKIPITGFGLLYKFGYFSQKIDLNGRQQEFYQENEWYSKPVKKISKNGEDLVITIKIKNEEVHLKVWKVNVGNVILYLLDANLERNKPYFRQITDYLYVSDREMRILQEIVLAFGAQKLMDKFEMNPTVYHLNEGHSAFLIIKRIKKLILENDFTFEEASEIVHSSTVFTTHTPVPAGNEAFEFGLVEKYISPEINSIGIDFGRFANFGKVEGQNNFSMSVLAILFSGHINGVSKLHSKISKKMWHPIYPNLCEEEMPIDAITNGVHLNTWLSRQITKLFDRYLGQEYRHIAGSEKLWKNIYSIPDIEIWEAHQQRKQQMVSFIRNKLLHSLIYRGSTFLNDKKISKILNPNYLIIGFARRFATYKRANLILHDKERLLKIIKDKKHPVQFVFAGKAHPADEYGKAMIKDIIDFAKEFNVEDSFVFIENYDINCARHIVQGVDVWLNNPIKPKEASGTSGMKAGMNGVLNCSVLDGWWPECYNKNNGWAITAGEGIEEETVRDTLDADNIYDIIENQIAPLYYNQDKNRIPTDWIKMMKNSIHDVGKLFNMHRMLNEYLHKFYLPVYKKITKLSENNFQLVRDTKQIEQKIQSQWAEINFVSVQFPIVDHGILKTGDAIDINVEIFCADIDAELFTVEMIYKYNSHSTIIPLKLISKQDKIGHFQTKFVTQGSGMQNLNIRLKPKDTFKKYHHLIKWYFVD